MSGVRPARTSMEDENEGTRSSINKQPRGEKCKKCDVVQIMRMQLNDGSVMYDSPLYVKIYPLKFISL